MKVEALSIVNPIKGRELYYIKFSEGEKDYVINVGKSTFDNVNLLLNGGGELNVSAEAKEEIKKNPVNKPSKGG